MNRSDFFDFDNFSRGDNDDLLRENDDLKQKILDMTEEQHVFVELYTNLIEDFKRVMSENAEYKNLVSKLESDINALQTTVNDLTMKNDITNTSFRGSNKKISSHRYSKGGNTKSNESYLLKNPAEKLNNNKTSHSKGKSFLTLGSAERTWEQENRLRQLALRSQARVQAIQSASVRRARITGQIKELVAFELSNSEYFDSATYESLEARLKAIEAFPYAQIRQDNLRRLKEFGYYDNINKIQVEKFNRAVRAVLTQAMSESNRRRSVSVVGSGNLPLQRFRKIIE